MSDVDKDRLAVETEVNLINMVYDTYVNKLTNVNYTEYIGRYKVNIPQYKLGLAEILVNKSNHSVIGLYGKIAKLEDSDKIIGIKLDLATNKITIDMIDMYGKLLESVNTEHDINKHCDIKDTSVIIGNDTFELS